MTSGVPLKDTHYEIMPMLARNVQWQEELPVRCPTTHFLNLTRHGLIESKTEQGCRIFLRFILAGFIAKLALLVESCLRMLVDKYLLDIVPAEKVYQLVCLMQSLHEGWDEAAMGNHILWHLQNMEYLQLYILLQTRQLTLQVFMKALINEGTIPDGSICTNSLYFSDTPRNSSSDSDKMAAATGT